MVQFPIEGLTELTEDDLEAKKHEGWSIPFAVAAGMGMDTIGG